MHVAGMPGRVRPDQAVDARHFLVLLVVFELAAPRLRVLNVLHHFVNIMVVGVTIIGDPVVFCDVYSRDRIRQPVGLLRPYDNCWHAKLLSKAYEPSGLGCPAGRTMST